MHAASFRTGTTTVTNGASASLRRVMAVSRWNWANDQPIEHSEPGSARRAAYSDLSRLPRHGARLAIHVVGTEVRRDCRPDQLAILLGSKREQFECGAEHQAQVEPGADL